MLRNLNEKIAWSFKAENLKNKENQANFYRNENVNFFRTLGSRPF
jgi:hypothetical protein